MALQTSDKVGITVLLLLVAAMLLYLLWPRDAQKKETPVGAGDPIPEEDQPPAVRNPATMAGGAADEGDDPGPDNVGAVDEKGLPEVGDVFDAAGQQRVPGDVEDVWQINPVEPDPVEEEPISKAIDSALDAAIGFFNSDTSNPDAPPEII